MTEVNREGEREKWRDRWRTDSDTVASFGDNQGLLEENMEVDMLICGFVGMLIF